MGGAELGLVVDALIDGAIIGEYTPKGQPKLDVVLRAVTGDNQLLPDAPALLSAPVATPSGRTVPLGALAKIEERLGPSVIRHLERRRSITLTVSPPKTWPSKTPSKRYATTSSGASRQKARFQPVSSSA